MPLLKTDDLAKNVPSVWLGDPSLTRWPFDASYGQWIGGFFLLGPVFVTMGFAVPVIVWMVLGSWFFGKFITSRFREDWPAFLLSRWTWRAVFLLFTLLAVPSPKSWVNPMNLIVALLLTPVVVFLIVRRYSRFFTPRTPLLYWIAVLWKILTRPRTPRSATAERKVVDPATKYAAELDFDLDELDLKDKK